MADKENADGHKYTVCVFFVRRKGMSKPPVKLGVDKSYLIEKERTSYGTMIAVWQPHHCILRRFGVNK